MENEKEIEFSMKIEDCSIDNLLHKLKIKNGRIKLDDFSIKGVTGYEIKKDSVRPGSLTELTIKMKIKDSEIET